MREHKSWKNNAPLQNSLPNFWTGSIFLRERFSWKQFRTKPSNDSFQQILSFFPQRAHEEADTMRHKISCQCVRDGVNCVRDSNIQCDCQPWDRTLLWANCSSKGLNHRFLCVKLGFGCFLRSKPERTSIKQSREDGTEILRRSRGRRKSKTMGAAWCGPNHERDDGRVKMIKMNSLN